MRGSGLFTGTVFGVAALVGGCQLIAGVKDAVPYPEDAGTGSGGRDGGATACEAGAPVACDYSGPMGTQDVGLCRAGTQTCSAEGVGDGVCSGEVTPQQESCAAPEDENCDGYDCVQWAELFGDGADQKATAVTVDADGNIFVLGTFAGGITANDKQIKSTGVTDIFLLKLDSTGKIVWGKAFGDASAQEGQAVAADSVGNVIIGGISASSISVGGTMLSPGLFVAKFDGDGKHIWSNGFGALGCGGTNDSAVAAISVTNNNDIAIAGRYCGSINFGDGAKSSNMGSQDGFVALLGGGSGSATNDGGWSKVFGDGGRQRAVGLGTGTTFDDIFLVGDLEGSINFGNASNTINSTGGFDIFYAKFSINGATQSIHNFGDTNNQYATAAHLDSNGTLAIAGVFEGLLDFKTGSIKSPASVRSAYAITFDSAEKYQWGKVINGSNFFGGVTDIHIDSSANVIIAGIYSGSIDTGILPLTAPQNNTDIFLAKLTPTGHPVWSKGFDGGSGFLSSRMNVSPASEPVLTGFISGTLSFGSGSLVPKGSNDGYVAKFAP